MTTLTAIQQSFIDLMKQNDELARKGFQLLLQRPDYPHFFAPLDEATFFAPECNPVPVPGERPNSVWIPYWAPLDYLKAVAQHAGAHNDQQLAVKIMTVVRNVTAWRDNKGQPRRNYHTNRVFAEILGLVPTSIVTLADIDLVAEWLNDPYDRMLTTDALDKTTVPRFLKSASPDDWQKTTRILYHATAIAWRTSANDREPTPFSIVNDFWLRELLTHHAREIGAKAGAAAAEIMLARTREVFGTPLRREHSTVFRPAVENEAQNHDWRNVENRMVEGLRDVLLGWAATDPNNSRTVVQRMLTDDNEVIRRTGVYVLAQYWAEMRELYSAIVARGFFNSGHRHELYHLLRDHFGEMTPEQQAATLAAIKVLPLANYGEDPNRLRRHNQYRWLSAIHGKGNAAADAWFEELDQDQSVGKLSEHPDFDSYITGWVGPSATPYAPEELAALARAQLLVDKLNTFTPSDDWRGPTTEGLTSALETAARTTPEDFLENLEQILAAQHVYQNAIVNGLKQAWEAKADLDWTMAWEHLVNFFERLVNNKDFWQSQDLHRRWVVASIADCLHAGTKTDDHAYDPRLLPRTQAIIAEILRREPGIDHAADDAMTQAINTAKGRAIEAFFSQALRAARVDDRQAGNHGQAWEAIRPVFEAELARCTDANFEFSTLCGTYLPQLQYLDHAWTNQNIEHIFPQEYDANTVCALDGLAYAAFTGQVYELLMAHGILDRALRLELKGRSAREKLLERIGAAYLWGLETLDGNRFRHIFAHATVADLDVLTRVFWMVRNEQLTAEQRERVLAFWEHSVTWAQQQQPVPERLLSLLSMLATHITTLGAREQHMLETVAPYVHVGHETYEFIAQLLRLAPQDPAKITKVLQVMVTAHAPDYDYQDRLKALLQFLAEHGQREAVILLSNPLRHLEGVQILFKTLTQH